MYTKSGSSDEARLLFDELRHGDMITWTAMIAGYAKDIMGQRAVNFTGAHDGEAPLLIVFRMHACRRPVLA